MSKKKSFATVNAYWKFAIANGLRCVDGVDPYAYCASILSKLGYERRAGESEKVFCARYTSYIDASITKHKWNKSRSNIPKASPKIEKVYVKPVANTFAHVMTDAFLSSFEWRRVRMVALKKYGPVCQCCGATPATGAVMNVDHIKPRKIFPELALTVENLQILCHECNHGKGNWDMTDWRFEVGHTA